MSEKLKKGMMVTVNVPFTYTIGDTGFATGKVLRTIEDCENEVRAEIDNGMDTDNMELDSEAHGEED
jgi:hypothetical protein